MVRVKKNWNQAAAPRSLPQMANAIGATIWKLAANVLLNLENENFETTTQAQRVDILEEVVCYLVHFCDRWLYPQTDHEQRSEFISSLVRDMARMLEDSRIDVQGEAKYQAAFVDTRRAGVLRCVATSAPTCRKPWASATGAGYPIT
jgi:hypothetical protein